MSDPVSDTPPPPIDSFAHLIAVVTGGGTGMGRELTRLLAAEGCSVAICDVDDDEMLTTIELATAAATGSGFASARFTRFVADVSDRAAMDAFAAHVASEFRTDHVNLLFNNAGVGGAGSFVVDPDEVWDSVFGVCWGGVLNGSRSFRSMLLASERGQIINTSSINGMWACLGPFGPHTAYSAAKFAVKGFTEALMVDFRVNAPHLTAAVVMPGHVGTHIMGNSMRHQGIDPKNVSDEQVAKIREDYERRGIDLRGASDEDIRHVVLMRAEGFLASAPTTATDAAASILDGIRAGSWRILIGEDAVVLDERIREAPDRAYSVSFMQELSEAGHLRGLVLGEG